MGLDVDIYRITGKKTISECEDCVYNDNYIETVYLRKPFEIWNDYLEITNYKRNGIISDDYLEKIEKMLINHTKTFANKLNDDNEYYMWKIWQATNFYQIIQNHKNGVEDETLYIESSC